MKSNEIRAIAIRFGRAIIAGIGFVFLVQIIFSSIYPIGFGPDKVAAIIVIVGTPLVMVFGFRKRPGDDGKPQP
ncbi:MAG: hypothetical protein JNJ45_11875 [Chthonomonas sp.]|nr:hypothetical protein [Chthonomonas sp.]